MCCADFFLLKTLPSLDLSKFLFFGVAGNIFTCSHIATALRVNWGNDERLRSHDIAFSQQLQNGHIVGSAHWTGEQDGWQETDLDYGETAGTMERWL